jgi:hypothetical protein
VRVGQPAESELPSRRVVLLGASNLARGLATVIPAAQAAWGQPLDILAALGHGRGYARVSRVFGRVLPPIVECGLWQTLTERPSAPTAVLLTDIGNDLVLGASPDSVVESVESCLARLTNLSQQVALTELPLASLEQLGPHRYRLLRAVFFPRSRLGFEQAWEYTTRVNQQVKLLAEKFGAVSIVPRSEWFGFDPIHIRRSVQAAAWQEIFSRWSITEQCSSDRSTRLSGWYLHFLRPHYRKWFGFEQHQAQPAAFLRDGSALSLF